MKWKYNGSNKLRRTFNEYAGRVLVIYAVLGSICNYDKTGHHSADLATGRVQPTALEEALSAFGEALLFNAKNPSPIPPMK